MPGKETIMHTSTHRPNAGAIDLPSIDFDALESMVVAQRRRGTQADAPAGAPSRVDSRRAWTIAAGAFVANVAVFGALNSFGVFFDAMAAEFDAGSGAVALMFAVTMFVYFSLGAVTGPIADRIGPRRLLVAGGALVATGLLLTSIANSIWMGYAAYGAGVGAGAACVQVPMLATVGGWFDRQRTAALGLASSGIAAGTMIASPLSAHLIDAIGFRQTFAIYGVAVFAVLVAVATVVERPPERVTRARGGTRDAARELAAKLYPDLKLEKTQ